MSKPTLFQVTEKHIELLKRMHILWNGGAYDGAPEIDPKRPYGNSDVIKDVIEILGLEDPVCPHCNQSLDQATHEQTYREAQKLHREMDIVLQICVQSPETFKPGTYEKTDTYSNQWQRVIASK